MKFSLIICTYMRSKSLLQLLQSVKEQTLYPDEILIIDGSANLETKNTLKENHFENLNYYLVPQEHRGLTKQRNFGIKMAGNEMGVICFLDDDTVLEKEYFKELIKTFEENPAISGVGGVAINENRWTVADSTKKYDKNRYYQWEGFVYKEGQRNVVRNYLGLHSNLGPGQMPNYSHGRTCSFPLTGKVYEVDLLIGMSMAFRKSVLDEMKFSTYFYGYGLYEDADFSLRVARKGKLYINTAARLEHHHAPAGRPNDYRYGKMVVRNGWYVWRVKNPNPSINDRFKWNAITLLLTAVRWGNVITAGQRKQAFTEALGRTVGWLSLLLSKPKLLLDAEEWYRLKPCE